MKDKRNINEQQDRNITRRDFIGGAAATAMAFTIVPRYVLGGSGYTPPSEKLNIAGIGVGGKGAQDVERVSSENIVALCDVDARYAAATFKRYPKARKYRDFRKMLEKQKDIDAVMVATPDHTHAVISMMAIEMGKHVYCQKPLTHTIWEARKVTEAARRHRVVTQIGTQTHATEALKILVEMIKSGVIGDVLEVHVWSDRPVWPQGIDRPGEMPPVPATLDWDLWLGPARYRPYHPAYLPFKWRGWWDFGCGALGDMACHIMDPAFWALDLGYSGCSVSVEARTTKFNSETYPVGSVLRYEFGARGDMPPVELTWYDDGMLPWRPAELEQERSLPTNGGLYIGDKGTILAPHGGGARLIPESKMRNFRAPEPFLPRGVDHYQEWVRACKGGPKPLSNFDYAGPLTELVLLGNIAIRTGKKLEWDGPSTRVTNVPEANEYVCPRYRAGWTL